VLYELAGKGSIQDQVGQMSLIALVVMLRTLLQVSNTLKCVELQGSGIALVDSTA
jgi:hypothetical protein